LRVCEAASSLTRRSLFFGLVPGKGSIVSRISDLRHRVDVRPIISISISISISIDLLFIRLLLLFVRFDRFLRLLPLLDRHETRPLACETVLDAKPNSLAIHPVIESARIRLLVDAVIAAVDVPGTFLQFLEHFACSKLVNSLTAVR
jgi:hypothetical protein